MKRFISLILTVLMLTVPFASCSGGTLPDETSDDLSSDTSPETSNDTVLETTSETTAETTSESSDTSGESESETSKETDPPETEETYADGLIRLSKDGKALYRVTRAQTAGTNTKNLAMELTKHLNNLESDVEFELKTDTYPIAQNLEILIGNTSHEESAAAADGLEVNGWAVKKIGGKIVIFGTTVKALSDAAEYFYSCVSVNAEGDVVLDLDENGYVHKGSAPFFNDDQPLSSFVIATSPAFSNLAAEIQTHLNNIYHTRLDIINSDADEAEQNEILVGAYSREETKSALSSVSEKTDGYIVKAEGSKLIIAGHSTVSTMIAVNALLDLGFDKELSDKPQISTGVLLKSDSSFGDNVSAKELTDGAEIRIMSFNVLSEMFCDISSESRKLYTANTILTYMPDVIGFQEFDGYYQSNIRPLISDDYEIILGRKDDNSVGYNGIAYNKNTLTLLNKGYVEYRQTAQGRNHKYLAYGIFRTKSTNETFALINLHWDVKDDYKMMQCEDTVALISEIRSQYSNCPVFITGDYNTNRHTDYFKALLTNANTQSAEVSAANKINDEYTTYHGIPLGTLPGKRDTSIDHVVHTSNATALTYKVIIDLPTLYASDHNPVIADFVLN
ncbi:MAG: endonuclease/exonuclease/phosphatase family protein [Clostridia bacterium]|nr:endonuclease/exonuclease/phosphatase family protein [Clostridia bacterium]